MYPKPIDLSKEFHPCPKPAPRGKKPKKAIKKVGKRTAAWLEGQPKLKDIFKDHGITTCEIGFQGCKANYLLGFAHVRRRGKYKIDELADPHHVVLADQWCHNIVDDASKTPKDKAEKILQSIVDKRGW